MKPTPTEYMRQTRENYEKLGFEFIAGPVGPEPVAIMEHPSGININFILNKLNLDGHLNTIKSSLDSIFGGEISYIAKKLVSKRNKKSNELIKKQIKTNIYIFIKNLKVIMNIMGELIS